MAFSLTTSELFYQRLLEFAKRCQRLVVKLPRAVYNIEYGGQLIRSSASPGSNYIEAIEACSRREFIHKLKICRKEAKESIHWLVLIRSANKELTEIVNESDELINEAREFVKIFTSSVLTSEKNQGMSKFKNK